MYILIFIIDIVKKKKKKIKFNIINNHLKLDSLEE